MKKAVLLGSDEALLRMLALELETQGWEAARIPENQNPPLCDLVIAEGEEMPEHPVAGMRAGACPWIIISRAPGAFLHRLEMPEDRETEAAAEAAERGEIGMLHGGIFLLGRPFSVANFLYCVQHLVTNMPAPDKREGGHTLTLNSAQHRATLDGRSVELTPKEAELLSLLMEAGGKPVPRERILKQLFPDAAGNVLEVYIRYLRQKLEEPQGLRLIRTVRGVGYRLDLFESGRDCGGADAGLAQQ